MGGSVSTGRDNEELVDNLVKADYIHQVAVEKAFRCVDRGEYLLPTERARAYTDAAWRSGHLHLSAPCIYAEVVDCLDLRIGLSFLNLGSGTGYLSTVVGHIIGRSGVNHGVEVYDDVISHALDRLAYRRKFSDATDQLSFCEPQFVCGNCLLLDPPSMLYDRIYVGAAVPEESLDYVKGLLNVGGILVLPFEDQLRKITRLTRDSFETKCVLPVSFASLIVPTTEQLKNLPRVTLPEVSVHTLVELCREAVRETIVKTVEQKFPDDVIHCQLTADRSPSDEPASGGCDANNRSRNSHERVVVPIVSGSGRGGRGRRRIIAIGSADISRGAPGRLDVGGIRWEHFQFLDNSDRDEDTEDEEDSNVDNTNNAGTGDAATSCQKTEGEKPESSRLATGGGASCSTSGVQPSVGPRPPSEQDLQLEGMLPAPSPPDDEPDLDDDGRLPNIVGMGGDAEEEEDLEDMMDSEETDTESRLQTAAQRARGVRDASQRMHRFSVNVQAAIWSLPIPVQMKEYLNYRRPFHEEVRPKPIFG